MRLVGDNEDLSAGLLAAVEQAESIIVETIGRECDALRSGRMLAARAIRTRLCDCAQLYINTVNAARAALETVVDEYPDLYDKLEYRRAAFAALLRVEMATLAAARARSESEMADAALLAKTA